MRRFKPITTDGKHFGPTVHWDDLDGPHLVLVRKHTDDEIAHHYTVEMIPLEAETDG